MSERSFVNLLKDVDCTCSNHRILSVNVERRGLYMQ